jgi:hypothetical protein
MVSTHLRSGARFELRRQSVDNDAATYQATIERPGGVQHLSQARVHLSGEIVFDERGEEGSTTPAPEWMNAYLKTLLRQLVRAYKRDQKWPRSVRQWRAEKATS